jgi:tetratricopeptide (TPR) repeat protein
MDEAESLLLASLDGQRRVLGNDNSDTLSTMERLAELYRRQEKYDQAQTLLTAALDANRRVLGPQHPDTVMDLYALGLVRLQQKNYDVVESLLGAVVAPDKTPVDSWTWYQCKTILGAALAAQKRYAEAEKLLLDGYLGTSDRLAILPADGLIALDRTGQWIVQLYRDWGKADTANEWREKLSRSKSTQNR